MSQGSPDFGQMRQIEVIFDEAELNKRLATQGIALGATPPAPAEGDEDAIPAITLGWWKSDGAVASIVETLRSPVGDRVGSRGAAAADPPTGPRQSGACCPASPAHSGMPHGPLGSPLARMLRSLPVRSVRGTQRPARVLSRRSVRSRATSAALVRNTRKAS